MHSDSETTAADSSTKRQLENKDDPDFASKRIKPDHEPAEHRQPQEDTPVPSSSTQTKENVKAQKGRGKEKEKEKRDRRRGTRGDRDRVPLRTDSDGQTPRTDESKAPRLPKRQCALLIGFSGSGYFGMQSYVCVFMSV